MCDDAENLAGAGTDVRRCSDALGPRKTLHIRYLPQFKYLLQFNHLSQCNNHLLYDHHLLHRVNLLLAVNGGNVVMSNQWILAQEQRQPWFVCPN